MIPLLARLAGAAAGGALLAASFPPVGLWWTAILAIAVVVVVLSPVRGSAPRARTGTLVGFVAGLVFFLLLVPWVGLYVGAYAAWGLSVVEALYLAAFGAGATVILRAGLAPGPRGVGRAAAALLGVAGWWSLWEWIRSTWPWGGFPWGRLAFGQADGPLLPLVSLGGTPLLGFVVAALGAALGFAVVLLSRRDRPVRVVTGLVAVPLVSVGLVAVAAVDFDDDDEGTQPLTVAVIQGNVPRLGLDFNAQRRAVLNNHLSVTGDLADRVDAGEVPRPEVVMWPENASDISPLADASAAAQISALNRRLEAPILVGTVLPTGEGREATNSYLVWDGRTPGGGGDGDGAGGVGDTAGGDGPVLDRHDKKYIQPFGEWLPMRAPLEALFPIARTAGHFVPGDGDGVITAAGVEMGVAICFEVAFDPAAREPVARGAQLLTVPTNNATFGHSPMTYQQLAMSRVRAVEHNVPVLIGATSGVSAVIGADGEVQQETEIFEPAALVAQVEIGSAGTMATRLGSIPQAVCCLIGLVGLAWAVIYTRRQSAHDPKES